MLATLTDAPFDDPAWVFETKWDGFRMVASIERGKVTLYSRNGTIVSDNYLPVARALEKVKRDGVIDGELVALDAQGISRFQLLQNALRAEAKLARVGIAAFEDAMRRLIKSARVRVAHTTLRGRETSYLEVV